jgi:hypothetical protein
MPFQTDLVGLHRQLDSEYKKIITTAETKATIISLSQSDFVSGTYIISTPGVYRLSEDISFNPNSLATIQVGTPSATSWDSGSVLSTQFVSNGGDYDDKAYALGFFAAIAIITNDVVLDLNGYTLEQSKEHCLQQRFYANIELNDQPFIPNQGPNDFGSNISKSSNLYVVNGTIGRSSHHGIHSNGNSRVLLEGLNFIDYEVAAIAMNGIQNAVVSNCTIEKSRTDVPILGTFSAGRFIRKYLDMLITNGYTGPINIAGVNKTTNAVKNDLKTAMNNTFSDIISNGIIDKATHLPEWQLFHNDAKVIDGNSYGIVTNSLGVAVHGFPDQYTVRKSQNVFMTNVTVNNHTGKINEVLALPNTLTPVASAYGNGGAQNDPIGAVFQTQNKDADDDWVTATDGTVYVGNALANAQALVAQAIIAEADFGTLNTSRNSITQATLDWISGNTAFTTLVTNSEFMCNGDSMFHVNKGVIGYKIDATDYVYMKDCKCLNVDNLGSVGSNKGPADYKNKVGKSITSATYYGYGGANTRGWSLASTSHAILENCSVVNIKSNHGSAYGFDVHLYGNDITILNCEANEIHAGCADGLDLNDYQSNPTEFPVAYGLHVNEEVESFHYNKLRSNTLTSPYKSIPCSINMKHIA